MKDCACKTSTQCCHKYRGLPWGSCTECDHEDECHKNRKEIRLTCDLCLDAIGRMFVLQVNSAKGKLTKTVCGYCVAVIKGLK